MNKEEIINKIKNTRILALIGLISVFLGTLFPYVQYTGFGMSYGLSLFKYWEGKLMLLLIITSAMYIFNDFIKKYIPQMFDNEFGKFIQDNRNPKFALIPTVLIVLLTLYLTSSVDMSYSKGLSYGLGFFLVWIGVISLVAFAFLYDSSKLPVMETQVENTNTTTIQDFNQQSAPINNSNQTVFCTKCGKQHELGLSFCPSCGNKL